MKRLKKLTLISSFLICIVLLLPILTVEAGKTTVVMNEQSLADKAYWFSPNEDVLLDNQKITFTEDSEEDTKLISRPSLNVQSGYKEAIVVEGDVKFDKLPAGETFVIGLGLEKIDTAIGDDGNVEITFTNNNGIKLGAYSQVEGKKNTIFADVACGMSVGQKAKVRIVISDNKALSVSVQGKTIGSGTLSVSGAGRIGFLQTGSCALEISGLKITSYNYERPENTNVSEDFEKGIDISKLDIINTSEVNGTEWYPNHLAVEEYEGNNVLMFSNVGGYYFTTKYQYSNFEMTFDVPYIDYDKETKGAKSSFGIYYGCPDNVNGIWAELDSIDLLLFKQDGTISSAKQNAFEITEETYRIWENCKPFSVKVSMVDGNVQVGLKWMNESTFKTVASYTLETGSPTGYIRFGVPSQYLKFAIDNIKITNLDDEPNVIDTEYENGIVKFEDFEYEPFERVYKDNISEVDVTGEESKKFSWYLIIPTTALVGALFVGVCAGIAGRKKASGKEEVSDEK